MSAHVYHEIFLHVNWHTQGNLPVLTGAVEELAYQCLAKRCRDTPGVYYHAIGGTDDHVHLAFSVEPAVTPSKVVQTLEGGSAHDVSAGLGADVLHWQRGYGIDTFGKANLPWVVNYVRHQREHHANGRTSVRPEACTAPTIEKPAEAGSC